MSKLSIPKGWRRVPTGVIKQKTDKYKEASEDGNDRLCLRWVSYGKGYPEAVGTPVTETNFVIRRRRSIK